VIKEKRAKLESVNCLETEELSFGKLLIYSYYKDTQLIKYNTKNLTN